MIATICADAAHLPLAGGSVHCVVTSPPYYGLRIYTGVPGTVWGGDPSHAHAWGVARRPIKVGQVAQTKWSRVSPAADGQRAATGRFCACGAWFGMLGNEASVDLYVAHVVECFREIRRVLRDDGVAFLILGDSFSGAGGAHKAGSYDGGTGRAMPAGAPRAPTAAPAGNLLGIPWRVALALQADVWIVRNDLAWCKTSAMPESLAGVRWERHRVKVSSGSVKRDGLNGSGNRQHGSSISEPQRAGAWPDRPQQGHGAGVAHAEFAARAEWTDCPGCAKCASNGGLVLRRGSWRHTRAHEYVFMLAKTPGYYADAEAVAEPAVSTHGSGNGYAREGRESYADVDGPRGSDEPWNPALGATRNPRSFVVLGPQPYAGAHFAAFPEALIEPLILASTSAKGVCATCGAPWARIVERPRTLDGASAALPPMRNTNTSAPDSAQGVGHWRIGSTSRTLGWRRTCAHADAPAVPPVVLDPFAGTGTVGRVAVRHGRRAILCDMSETYLRDLVPERTSGVQMEIPT